MAASCIWRGGQMSVARCCAAGGTKRMQSVMKKGMQRIPF
jgi:hypothetical protein